MKKPEIRFSCAKIVGKEEAYLQHALSGGRWEGGGSFGRKCEELLEHETGAQRVLLTPSCTAALELAALLLDIQPGDEVILPSFTFVSTANAFVLRGARPVFVDIRSDTLNMDETRLEEFVTPKTKAVVPVHYAGIACELDTIREIADWYGIPVVEDNAQGLFGAYRDRPLGSFGALSVTSFHGTKNITCGEGGALFINHPQYVDRAEILREKGTDRARFLRGQVDRYTWRDIGSSFLLAEPLAAILLAQLEERESICRRRRAIWEMYKSKLDSWASRTGVALPTVPSQCTQSYHLFYMLMPSTHLRDAIIRELHEQRIQAVFHYQPLHASSMGCRLGTDNRRLRVTEHVAARLVRLPLHAAVSEEQAERICEAIVSFRG